MKFIKNFSRHFSALAIAALTICLVLGSMSGRAQSGQPTIGAYYFNDWTSMSNPHITASLQDSFRVRKPKWGWITSTQALMDTQINLAAASGLSFFAIEWFNPNSKLTGRLNEGLGYYLNSKNKSELKFCLLIVNHSGFEISPEEWPGFVNSWIGTAKDKQYLTVDGDPLIVFFSCQKLILKFKSVDSVKAALDYFRQTAVAQGLKGLKIAVTVSSVDEAKLAEQAGFDLTTGYNYHTYGFKNNSTGRVPIDSMAAHEPQKWNVLSHATKLKYMPLCTLNWDPRPWNDPVNKYYQQPYYGGYSGKSVYRSVGQLKDWMNQNPDLVTTEKIAFLYAWNEYGEGAWLTPSENDTLHLIDGLKRALK